MADEITTPPGETTAPEAGQQMTEQEKYQMYVDGLTAAKEEVMTTKESAVAVLAQIKKASEFINEIKAETEAEFPYAWQLGEMERNIKYAIESADAFDKDVALDIEAFTLLANGEPEAPKAETPAAPAADATVIKTLQGMLENMQQ